MSDTQNENMLETEIKNEKIENTDNNQTKNDVIGEGKNEELGKENKLEENSKDEGNKMEENRQEETKENIEKKEICESNEKKEENEKGNHENIENNNENNYESNEKKEEKKENNENIEKSEDKIIQIVEKKSGFREKRKYSKDRLRSRSIDLSKYYKNIGDIYNFKEIVKKIKVPEKKILNSDITLASYLESKFRQRKGKFKKLNWKKLTQWQKGALKTCFHQLNENQSKAALGVFKLIQQYMGDVKASMDVKLIKKKILENCFDSPAIRNEVVLMMAKQCNGNQKKVNLAKGLQLMATFFYCYSPSEKDLQVAVAYLLQQLQKGKIIIESN
jgi:hypothetical protein